MLDNGALGVLVEPKMTQDLVDKLIVLCDELHSGQETLKKNKLLKDEVKERFSSKMMADSYTSVYKSIVAIN